MLGYCLPASADALLGRAAAPRQEFHVDSAHRNAIADLLSVSCTLRLSRVTTRCRGLADVVDDQESDASSWREQQSLDLANEGVRALQATATNLDNIEAAAAVPHDRLVQVPADACLSPCRRWGKHAHPFICASGRVPCLQAALSTPSCSLNSGSSL